MKTEEIELLNKLQVIIRKNMGNLEYGDRIYLNGKVKTICNNYKLLSAIQIEYFKHDAILIPDSISRDSERPERGLWGMIDWKHINITIDMNGDINNGIWYENPYLALLKILKSQVDDIKQESKNEIHTQSVIDFLKQKFLVRWVYNYVGNFYSSKLGIVRIYPVYPNENKEAPISWDIYFYPKHGTPNKLEYVL